MKKIYYIEGSFMSAGYKSLSFIISEKTDMKTFKSVEDAETYLDTDVKDSLITEKYNFFEIKPAYILDK